MLFSQLCQWHLVCGGQRNWLSGATHTWHRRCSVNGASCALGLTAAPPCRLGVGDWSFVRFQSHMRRQNQYLQSRYGYQSYFLTTSTSLVIADADPGDVHPSVSVIALVYYFNVNSFSLIRLIKLCFVLLLLLPTDGLREVM